MDDEEKLGPVSLRVNYFNAGAFADRRRLLTNDLDLSSARRTIVAFIKRKVEESQTDGAVIGLSGGIDSAVTAYLSVEALGSRRVTGLIMPDLRATPEQDVKDAKLIASELCIETKEIDIAPIHKACMKSLQPDRLAEGNLRARIRMSLLYYHANMMNRLVMGTGDRSELLLGFFCYDDKTRVATSEGLRGMDELKVGDVVFSYDFQTNKVVESKVDNVFTFDYDGEMINFTSRNTDLLVTPNHRMLVCSSSSGDYRYVRPIFRTAEECLRRRYTRIPVPTGFDGRENLPTNFSATFSQKHVQRTISINAEDFFFLFGLFIGDGCAVKGKAVVPVRPNLTRQEFLALERGRGGRYAPIPFDISQPSMKEYETYETDFALPSYTKDRARKQLTEILAKYGIGYSLTRDLVRIPSRGIYDLFRQCGLGAHQKHIPPWILEYPSKYLDFLHRGLHASDGNHSGAGRIYFTSSPRLRDDFAELCVKLGRMPMVRTRPPRTSRLKNGKVINSGEAYEIVYAKEAKRGRTIDNRKASMVRYKGKVWCPSVPPHENILVERNGKYSFCGNTKHGDGGVDLLPIADLYKTEVRRLGEVLGINRRIVAKRSSPRLWPGHIAETEIGMTYETIDRLFKLRFDEGLEVAEIASRMKVSQAKLDVILEKHERSQHKRKMPEICKLR